MTVGIKYLKRKKMPLTISYKYNSACFGYYWRKKPLKGKYNIIALTFQIRNQHMPVAEKLLKEYSFLQSKVIKGTAFEISNLQSSWGTSKVIRETPNRKTCDVMDYTFLFKRKEKQDDEAFATGVLAIGHQLRFLSLKESLSWSNLDKIDALIQPYLDKKRKTGKNLFELISQINNEVFLECYRGHSISSVLNNPWYLDLETIAQEEVLNNSAIKKLRSVSLSNIITESREL